MEDDPNKEFSAAEPQEVPSTYEKLEDDYDIDEEITDEEDDRDFEAVGKPAMVINVQSWAIPIIGLVMLLVGIAAGYAGREIVASLTRENAAPSVTEAASAESTGVPAGEVSALPSITPQQPSAEEQEELMTFLVSQTKHFIGEADAPVTIIEFSDFQ